jgi:hypothetical protein
LTQLVNAFVLVRRPALQLFDLPALLLYPLISPGQRILWLFDSFRLLSMTVVLMVCSWNVAARNASFHAPEDSQIMQQF